eukprot:scaffold57799_cov30-Tisochrysis_lutea.AAC.3
MVSPSALRFSFALPCIGSARTARIKASLASPRRPSCSSTTPKELSAPASRGAKSTALARASAAASSFSCSASVLPKPPQARASAGAAARASR